MLLHRGWSTRGDGSMATCGNVEDLAGLMQVLRSYDCGRIWVPLGRLQSLAWFWFDCDGSECVELNGCPRWQLYGHRAVHAWIMLVLDMLMSCQSQP